MNKKLLLYLVFILISFHSYSQKKDQDIKSYKFRIELTDHNDTIRVKSTIKGNSRSKTVVVNLTNNMLIDSITYNNNILTYSRINDSLYISVNHANFEFNIFYKGVPQDGLIIGENKFGDRTFFGDNWPNRAKNWLSVYDHPFDKAKVEFIVSVPRKYKVVANGKFLGKTNKDSIATYHYKTSYQIPTKLMVIGVAEFISQTVQKSPFEITSFVYPQDKYSALTDYSLAPQITTYFESLLGRYPFDKLYNVQSTTKYGGMENAGCIFYDENSVDGKFTNENLIAHEIAHQWFGNSVTEKDWQHVWLSEGFATYLENLYMESKYPDTLNVILEKERLMVLDYKSEFPNSVLVPKKVSDPNMMLNPYSYQKGAWVLHMIKSEIGDDNFYKVLSSFYRKYKFSNANTNEFVSIISKVYGKDIKPLLEPWLYSSSLPVYQVKWKFNNGKVKGIVEQLQDGPVFINDLYLLYNYPNIPVLKKISITSKSQKFEFDSSTAPLSLEVDPHNLILKGK